MQLIPFAYCEARQLLFLAAVKFTAETRISASIAVNRRHFSSSVHCVTIQLHKLLHYCSLIHTIAMLQRAGFYQKSLVGLSARTVMSAQVPNRRLLCAWDCRGTKRITLQGKPLKGMSTLVTLKVKLGSCQLFLQASQTLFLTVTHVLSQIAAEVFFTFVCPERQLTSFLFYFFFFTFSPQFMYSQKK